MKNFLRLIGTLCLLFSFPALASASTEASSAHHIDAAVYGLVFCIAALLIGALVRFFFQKTPLPFTVILLMVGMGLGALSRADILVQFNLQTFDNALIWASEIDPHLLLFVFLPILIFEASFNMDLHTFKKTGINSAILAIPGIVLGLLIVAAMVMSAAHFNLGFQTWTWQIALMFGAVICATDPVAVVAILKELGTSKRLGTLIEGESLLNDGTSLVIFMVLMASLTGEVSNAHPIIQFLIVAGGGTLLGVLIGNLFLGWIARVFRDALIEISAVIAAAYLTFYLAEYVFHVSGVLALVALGLSIGGFGKAKISPSVEHFMEEFWELAGFMANCIIFIIVGIIISMKTVFTVQSFLLLFFIYLVIHIARALMMLLFYPAMKKIGYGISKQEAIVVWFGGLRGALALSLGLIFLGIDSQYVSEQIKNEFFFLISGTVALTLLINATVAERLIKFLGLTNTSAATRLIRQKATHHLNDSLQSYLEEMKADRYLKKANWDVVADSLATSSGLSDHQQIEFEQKVYQTRIQLLEIEKSSYWKQFKDGLLGVAAVSKLNDTINHIIDMEGKVALSERKDLEMSWSPPRLYNWLNQIPVASLWSSRQILNRLYDSYDGAVSMIVSQKKCLEVLNSMLSSKTILASEYELLESEIQDNIIQCNTFIRNLRRNHPEIYSKINTKQASRLLLNKERSVINQMAAQGIIDDKTSDEMRQDLSIRVKKVG